LNEYVKEQSLLYVDTAIIEENFEAARALAKEYGIVLRLPKPRPRPHGPEMSGRDRCDWPWTSAYISYQGYAMPCCMASTPEVIQLGLINSDNFEQVWNGQPYNQFRTELAENKPPEICRFCSIYNGNF
jgi:radical SAM protein with 4Fe4S-binding SPASM domain